jgi:hypothetical protein
VVLACVDRCPSALLLYSQESWHITRANLLGAMVHMAAFCCDVDGKNTDLLGSMAFHIQTAKGISCMKCWVHAQRTVPYCHSVDWDSVPVHGLCPRPNCEVPITMPPPGTAGGYTLIERRWRCVQHYLFSCKASPCGCPDPTDLWADLWDLLPYESPARDCVRLALHVDSFDADSVCPGSWILSPSCRAVPALGVMLCAP